MADFDFNNIFGNNTDTSNILFDENQLSIIRDQFQKEIVTPLFQKYKNLYNKIENNITENINNKSFIDKSSDPIGLKTYKKNRNIDKKLDDITNPFLLKLENYYSELSKGLDSPSIFNFLPNINFTDLNDKIQKKVSDIENKLNIIDVNNTEEIIKKRKPSKLKSRSIPIDIDNISQDITDKLEPVKDKDIIKELEPVKDKDIIKELEPVKDKDVFENIEPVKDKDVFENLEPVKDKDIIKELEPLNNNFTVKDFSEDFSDNITVLIEETSLNRTILEKINDSIFSIKAFTSTYFSMFDKILVDMLPKTNGNDYSSNNIGLEQKKIGEETPEVSLSEKTLNKFKYMFSDLFISDTFKELFNGLNINNLKDLMDSNVEKNDMSLMGKIAALLLGAGLLMTLAGPVWDKFIKPWLEEKFGGTFKNFDELLGKYEKSFEASSKWLVTGGLGLTGKIFETAGKRLDDLATLFKTIDIGVQKIFTNFDEIVKAVKIGATAAIDVAKSSSIAIKAATTAASIGGKTSSVVSGAVDSAGSFGDDAVKATATVLEEGVEKKGSSIIGKVAAFFPNLGSKIFGTSGKAILKALPFVGSAFNLGYAWSDYEKGDYVSMTLNLGAAIAGLFPGVGTVVSIGLDVLNAFIDYNAKGTTVEDRNINKGFLFETLVKKIPLVSSLMGLVEGFGFLYDGNYSEASKKFERVPMFGFLAGFTKNLYESINVTSADGSVKMFDFSKFKKDMAGVMKKQLLAFVPDVFGFRQKVAEYLGITDYLTDTPEGELTKEESETRRQKTGDETVLKQEEYKDKAADITSKKEWEEKFAEEEKTLISTLETEKNQFEKDNRELEYLKKNRNDLNGFDEVVKDSEARYKAAEEQLKTLQSTKIKKADDMFDSPNNLFSDISNVSEGKYYYNPQNNTKTYLNPSDDVYALKRGGIIEENINKQLGEFTNVLLAGLRELKENTTGGSYLNNPINNITVSSVNGGDSNDSYTSGKRDPIFDLRSDWWKSSTMERIS